MTKALTGDPRLPAQVRVADDLVSRIHAGEWSATQALPSERALAVEYQVSVGTIRTVMARLVADGHIDRVQGRGTFVRRGDFSQSFLRFFRRGSSAQQPIGRVIEATVVTPEHDVDHGGFLQRAGTALGLSAGEELIHLRRIRLQGGEPVLLEQIALPVSLFAGLRDLEVGDYPNLLYPFYEDVAQQTVTTAIEELTIDRADVMDQSYLPVQPGDPIVQIARIAHGVAATPIEFRISRGPAQGFAYRMEIK